MPRGEAATGHATLSADAAARDVLTRAIVTLASQYGRYGYRRITALLRRAGWQVGKDRVERIWRLEGLKVPKKQKPRGHLWINDGSCVRLRPEHANHVWSYDFVSARTHDGRTVKTLNLVLKGVPEHIRSDNVLTKEGKAGEKKSGMVMDYAFSRNDGKEAAGSGRTRRMTYFLLQERIDRSSLRVSSSARRKRHRDSQKVHLLLFLIVKEEQAIKPVVDLCLGGLHATTMRHTLDRQHPMINHSTGLLERLTRI